MWFSNRHILLPGRLYGVFRTRQQCCCQDLFRSWDQDRELGLQVSRPRSRPWSSGLETETEPWTKWTRVHSSLETIWSRDHNTGCINSWYWWQSTRLKVATNYGNRATGVGTKHAVSRPIPWDQDRDLGKMNSSALESRDHGLEITTLTVCLCVFVCNCRAELASRLLQLREMSQVSGFDVTQRQGRRDLLQRFAPPHCYVVPVVF